MFTGLIALTGEFKGYRGGRKELLCSAPPLPGRLEIGDSLSVNGVCLSLLSREDGLLAFNLSRETLEKTTLGHLRIGERLNLEPPLTLKDPLGGHLVTGHIDAVGKVLKSVPRPPGKRLSVSFPAAIRPFFIPKGSVAVNGVSLTVASLGPSSFDAELIPLTLQGSNMGLLRPGDTVNIECDIIGKYVYNFARKP
ncbi:MAG: riboflavin synthase [Acidobacteriota bacterium]|nr:riboflavin synthase [Acidobacteriota bacterium]